MNHLEGWVKINEDVTSVAIKAKHVYKKNPKYKTKSKGAVERRKYMVQKTKKRKLLRDQPHHK